MSAARIDYSIRYDSFIVTDAAGAQLFSESGHPLVFSTRESAAEYLAAHPIPSS